VPSDRKSIFSASEKELILFEIAAGAWSWSRWSRSSCRSSLSNGTKRRIKTVSMEDYLFDSAMKFFRRQWFHFLNSGEHLKLDMITLRSRYPRRTIGIDLRIFISTALNCDMKESCLCTKPPTQGAEKSVTLELG
jgi:hypothetical protein